MPLASPFDKGGPRGFLDAAKTNLALNEYLRLCKITYFY